MADYIPEPDELFAQWQADFINYLNNNSEALGLVEADLHPLNHTREIWDVATIPG